MYRHSAPRLLRGARFRDSAQSAHRFPSHPGNTPRDRARRYGCPGKDRRCSSQRSAGAVPRSYAKPRCSTPVSSNYLPARLRAARPRLRFHGCPHNGSRLHLARDDRSTARLRHPPSKLYVGSIVVARRLPVARHNHIHPDEVHTDRNQWRQR